MAQEELQRQQTERVAEERRQRAQELDDLARRAVTQMVSRPLFGYFIKLVEGYSSSWVKSYNPNISHL